MKAAPTSAHDVEYVLDHVEIDPEELPKDKRRRKKNQKAEPEGEPEGEPEVDVEDESEDEPEAESACARVPKIRFQFRNWSFYTG